MKSPGAANTEALCRPTWITSLHLPNGIIAYTGEVCDMCTFRVCVK